MDPTIEIFSKRSILVNSILTSIYIPLYVYVLKENRDLLHIGKASSLLYLRYLVAAELVKIMVKYYFDTIDEKNKFKSKRYNTLSRKLKDYAKIVVAVCAAVVGFYILAVLFGAQLLSDQEETFMFSLLLTILTILPTYMHIGWENGNYVLLNLNLSHEEPYAKLMQRNIILTILGAWLSAVVMPLDWDRPWQIWPIPCCLGAIAGYLISHIVSLINYFFKGFDFINNFCKKTGKYGI